MPPFIRSSTWQQNTWRIWRTILLTILLSWVSRSSIQSTNWISWFPKKSNGRYNFPYLEELVETICDLTTISWSWKKRYYIVQMLRADSLDFLKHFSEWLRWIGMEEVVFPLFSPLHICSLQQTKWKEDTKSISGWNPSLLCHLVSFDDS